MSTKWYNRTIKFYIQNGGHAGWWTLECLSDQISALKAQGLSCSAAGKILALEYRLHSAKNDIRELLS